MVSGVLFYVQSCKTPITNTFYSGSGGFLSEEMFYDDLLDYSEVNVVKYVCRYRNMGSLT